MANRNYPKNVATTTVIPFDNPVTAISPKTITGATTFTKTTTSAQVGYGAVIRVTANGSNVPDLSAFKKIGSGTYDNTNGVVNQLWFVYDGTDYCVAITQPTSISAGDTTAPTMVSATATDATHITVVFSESVTPTTTGWSVFVTETSTTDGVSGWSGSGTTWILTVASVTMTSSQTIKISYNSTTGNTLDGAGNELATISLASVTNSIPSGTVLNAPTGVTLGTATSTTQPLTWTDANSSPNESGYKVYYNTVNTFGTATLATTTAANATSYTVTGLTASTTYYYWVVAAGNGTTTSDSAASVVASGSTASASATLENTTWIDWWNFAESSAIVTATSGSDTLLVKLWDQMNKVGATASVQTDTLVQGVTANQPKLIASGINGLPSLEISPSGPNYIGTSSIESKSKPLTFFLVAQPKLIPASQKNFMQSNSAAATANIGLDENGKVSVLNGSSTYLKGTTSMVVDGKYVIVVVFDTTTRIYVNGTLEASGSAGSDATAQLYTIGRDDAGCASAWLADIAIYQGDMDSTSRDSITTQLKTKYGIS